MSARSCARLLGLIALLLLPLESTAQAKRLPSSPTDIEVAMLPPYCQARLRGDAQSKDAWNKRLGRENFVHLHHYCNGLNYISRARAEMDAQTRNFYLQRAVAQFDYVLQRWAPSFPLYAEAQTNKMLVQSMRR